MTLARQTHAVKRSDFAVALNIRLPYRPLTMVSCCSYSQSDAEIEPLTTRNRETAKLLKEVVQRATLYRKSWEKLGPGRSVTGTVGRLTRFFNDDSIANCLTILTVEEFTLESIYRFYTMLYLELLKLSSLCAKLYKYSNRVACKYGNSLAYIQNCGYVDRASNKTLA